MMDLDVIRMVGVDKYRERKDFVDAEGHGLAAAYKRHNCCLPFVEKSMAACVKALDVGNRVLLKANHIGQESVRQISSDTAVSVPQDRASNGCITRWYHEKPCGVCVCCINDLRVSISTATTENRIDKFRIRELD